MRPEIDICLESRDFYQHTPLPGPDHIRLLIIQPAKRLEDPIECKVVFTQPGCSPKYVAISYTCDADDGDDLPRHDITIEGKRFLVTQSLFDGLRRVRKKRGHLRLWADAVCIHQSDPEEKAQQVARMANVYRHASWTAIWLGEGSADNTKSVIFRLFKQLSTTFANRVSKGFELVHPFVHGIYGEISEVTPGRCVCGYAFNAMALDTSEEVNGLRERCMNDDRIVQRISEQLREIARFIRRKYWTRQWIVQELFLSVNRCLLWGRFQYKVGEDLRQHLSFLPQAMSELETWLIRSPLELAKQPGMEIDELAAQTEQLSDLFDYVANDPADQGILDALHRSQGRQCKDPRDKVYSLLSFDPDKRISPDYTKTVAEVYTDFAIAIIERDQAGWLFYTLALQMHHTYTIEIWSDHYDSGDSEQIDLPSWVPDLRFQIGPPLSSIIREGPEFTAVKNGTALLCKLYVLGLIGELDLQRGDRTFQMLKTKYRRLLPITSESLALALAPDIALPENALLLKRDNESIEIGMPAWLRIRQMQELDLVCMMRTDDVYKGGLLLLRKDPKKPEGFLIVEKTEWGLFIDPVSGERKNEFPWEPQEAIIQIH